MHEIDQSTQMDIFYHAMNYTSKGILDAACCGAFKRKSVEEANQLIEDLVKSNYRAPSETSGSSSRLRGSGVIELNKMSIIEAKLDAPMNKVSMQERSNRSAHLVGTVEDQKKVLMLKDLLKMVLIGRKKFSSSMAIGVTTSSPTQIFQLITHQP